MGNIFKSKINFGAHKKQVLELNIEFSMISVSDWLVSISCFFRNSWPLIFHPGHVSREPEAALLHVGTKGKMPSLNIDFTSV